MAVGKLKSRDELGAFGVHLGQAAPDGAGVEGLPICLSMASIAELEAIVGSGMTLPKKLATTVANADGSFGLTVDAEINASSHLILDVTGLCSTEDGSPLSDPSAAKSVVCLSYFTVKKAFATRRH